MFDIRDFVSLACLTNTPFPNNFAVAATGIDKAEADPKDVISDIFDTDTFSYIVCHMRLFVAWGLGDLDKDLGLFIQERMWDYYERKAKLEDNEHGADSHDVEKMRHEIYGYCANAGYDFTGYQPCEPLWPNHKQIKTLDEFKKAFKEYERYDNGWQKRWVAARIRLADEWEKGKDDDFRRKRWPYLVEALSIGLKVRAVLLAAGLKGEF